MSQKDILGVDIGKPREDMEFSIYTLQTFYESRSPRVFASPHRLRFNAVIYITKGKGVHYIDYKMHRIKPGTMLFISKYQVHHFDYNPELEGYVVPFNDEVLYFGKDDPYRNCIEAALAEVDCIDNVGDDIRFYFDQLWRESHSKQHGFSGEVIRSLMRSIMLKSLVSHHQALLGHRNNTGDTQSFIQLKALIERHFRQSRVVGDYARNMGKSIKQINKIAKDNTGRTGKELIDDRVVLEAKRLLAFSHHSIMDIAFMLGFNEATNMCKFFRRHTDLTPKEFRELCRQNVAKIDFPENASNS